MSSGRSATLRPCITRGAGRAGSSRSHASRSPSATGPGPVRSSSPAAAPRRITWLPMDATGLVSPEALRAAIEQDPASVALITVMWANNEVGTVQPVNEMAEIARDHQIPFHSDAVQAAGQLPVHLAASGATALTITGH